MHLLRIGESLLGFTVFQLCIGESRKDLWVSRRGAAGVKQVRFRLLVIFVVIVKLAEVQIGLLETVIQLRGRAKRCHRLLARPRNWMTVSSRPICTSASFT